MVGLLPNLLGERRANGACAIGPNLAGHPAQTRFDRKFDGQEPSQGCRQPIDARSTGEIFVAEDGH